MWLVTVPAQPEVRVLQRCQVSFLGSGNMVTTMSGDVAQTWETQNVRPTLIVHPMKCALKTSALASLVSQSTRVTLA